MGCSNIVHPPFRIEKYACGWKFRNVYWCGNGEKSECVLGHIGENRSPDYLGTLYFIPSMDCGI